MWPKPGDSSKFAARHGMRKIVIHKPGGYRQLVIEEHPDPAPGQQQVLIEMLLKAYPEMTVKRFKDAMVFSPAVLDRIGRQLLDLGIPEG